MNSELHDSVKKIVREFRRRMLLDQSSKATPQAIVGPEPPRRGPPFEGQLRRIFSETLKGRRYLK